MQYGQHPRNFSLNEKRIEMYLHLLILILKYPSASMKRGLKSNAASYWLQVASDSPQWKEDWNPIFLAQSQICLASLNEKRIEICTYLELLSPQSLASMKRGLKCWCVPAYIPAEVIASMKRGLKLIYMQSQEGESMAGLNEKRIEISRGISRIRSCSQPQWKEDWNFLSLATSLSSASLSPQWKEDWNTLSIFSTFSKTSSLNEKRIEIKICTRCRISPCNASMKRGLKYKRIFAWVAEDGRASMKRGLKWEEQKKEKKGKDEKPQWKEDWNKEQIRSSLSARRLASMKRGLKSQIREWCPWESQESLNEKRIEIFCLQGNQPWCSASLNEKRIEIFPTANFHLNHMP